MKTYDLAKTISTFFLLLFCSFVSTQAQTTGGLSGTVKDQNDAVIQGASVTVKNDATNLTRSVVTNDEGRWTLTPLPVGVYSVTYEKDGFKKGVSSNVEVEASVTRTVEATLDAGISDVFVDVVSEQPLIQAETSAVSRQITGDQLIKTPTSTRSFTGLLSSESGVSTDLSPVATNGNGNQSPSVNGTRTTSTSLYFNGVDATNISNNEGSMNDNISPAPETLQEVKLQTTLYDASTGRSGGGNFQLVTRSGGNNLRGSAYYYLQNKKLTSNDFFFKEAGIEKPKADRREFGFTVGGPIKKDKLFFFGGYQNTKAETGFVSTASSRTVLPLALVALGENRGDKAAIAAAFNQFNGCAGANCLTANDISDVAFRLLNLRNPVTGGFVIPVPNATFRALTNSNGSAFVDQTGTGTFQIGFPATAARTLQRNNQLGEQRNVEPSRFDQQQFTLRMDANVTNNDIFSATFFFTNFPGFDSFPDPSSLASPFTLKRDDRNRTLSTAYTRIINPTLTNELRFGFFKLNNTRSLDDPFLTEEMTSAALGIINPALNFDNSPGTRRLGHFVGRNSLANFSFGGPNDSFNRRDQRTTSLSDNVSWVKNNHTVKFGVEYRRYQYDSNLPEEQGTEFEKFDNFTQLLTGNAQEADTQYGLTDKSFRFQDISLYVADDWKLTSRLTLNLGLRYEFFGLPTEKNGRIGNFDFTGFESCFTQQGGTLGLCDNIAPNFIVPDNVATTNLAIVDNSVATLRRSGNKHTLNGQDTNNFAPRLGLAFKVNDKFVVRGGYGLFYDRPSAAFINTVFSNFPFLREIEQTAPSGNVPIVNAWNNTPTNLNLSQWLPFRVWYAAAGNPAGSYQIRDNTPIFNDARGNLNPLAIPGGTCTTANTSGCIRGNIAETFEFRAVDRNLKTPFVHQFNVGFQYEIVRNLLVEARYTGTRGRQLLRAVAFNQGYDLNDPNTPDHIYDRFNQAYVLAGSPRGPLNSAASARERGRGVAFGFANAATGNAQDLNIAPNGSIINFEARVPLLGFNVPEALLLTNGSTSEYDSAQFSLTKRLSSGLQFNVAYTLSKSMDDTSSDPGSTAGSGRPDVPNTGFVTQGDQRDLDSNWARSDFDRTHRFSANFVYTLPNGGSNSRFTNGWDLSGFFQWQTGTPFTVFAAEPEINAATAAQYNDIWRGSGGLYRLGFGRPNFVCDSFNSAINQYTTSNVNSIIDRSCFASPQGGFGNLGRNTFRGPDQQRFDLGIVKRTKINERMSVDLGVDIFNVFNRVNLSNPNTDLADTTDFGRITGTVGGPRLAQIRAKLTF
ncbi:MAG: TonB-dependent receptor domain-containing protein [Pyrinomonadaceae bacterium]